MKHKIIFIIAVFVSSLIFGGFLETAEAADEDIAQQYAPIFYFEKEIKEEEKLQKEIKDQDYEYSTNL